MALASWDMLMLCEGACGAQATLCWRPLFNQPGCVGLEGGLDCVMVYRVVLEV